MKSKLFLTKLLFLACILSSGIALGQNTVSGTVTSVDNEPLPGATVIIEGTNEGTACDFDGNFSFTTSKEYPFKLSVSYVGFEPKTVDVKSSAPLTIELFEGLMMDEVVISASRKKEKITEAPASISVINARAIATTADVNPTASLANMVGVNIQQQSANRVNIEMRGTGANLFNTSVFPMLDYRSLVTPGSALFASNAAGTSTIDLDRIEVVRGPGGALYGPGVTSGVIHFISKSPIDHPGTTIELMGGELSTLSARIRHATKVSDKFGFKINVSHNQGDEFNYDPNNPEDVAIFSTYSNTVTRPAINENGQADLALPGTVLIDNLDEDGDGNPMTTDYYNTSINGTLEFRPQDDLAINVSGGYNANSEVFYTPTGAGFSERVESWGQARVQKGGLFAQAFYTDRKTGGGDDRYNFFYSSGTTSPVLVKYFESQLQYNFAIPSFLNADITVGADYRNSLTTSNNVTFGKFDAPDIDYTIFGGYAQAKFALADPLDLVLAARYDDVNQFDEGLFSPRAALVYKVNEKNSFRASYNKALAPPAVTGLFADFPIALAPSPETHLFTIWASGQKNNNSFENGVIDLTAPGFPDLPLNTPGLPLAVAYGALNAGNPAAGIPSFLDVLAGQGVPQNVLDFLAGYTPTGVTGQFAPYNVATGLPETPTNGSEPVNTVVESFEIGYNGTINNKLRVTADFYYNKESGRTNFTSIAPAYALAGANIGADLQNELAVALTDYFIGQGLDADSAAENAAPIAGAYGQGGTGFQGQIEPLFPIFGFAEGSGIPEGSDKPVTLFGFRNNSDVRTYWGTDIGLSYFFTNDLIGNVNYSYVSQVEWIPGEDNDDGVTQPFFANIPQNKYRFNLRYVPEKGFNGSISYRHTPSFFASEGLFSGEVDERNIVDLSLGYNFDNGLSLGIVGTNVFDTEYRNRVNMPIIGRRFLGKITYTFGGKK